MIRVWVGKSFTGGDPVQEYFHKEKEANAFIKKLVETREREGKEAFLLTFEQRFEALKAFQKLAPFNTSLTKAVTTYIEEHCVPVCGKTVDQVKDEFLKACRRANLKDRTVVQYDSDLSIFGESFGGSDITHVPQNDIEEWLDEFEWSARTKRNKLTSLTTFYTFAAGKQYCTVNPAQKIKRPKCDDPEVGIFQPDQSRALLYTAVEKRPDLVGGLAIATFLGPRRSELCALDWLEVDVAERTLVIQGSKSKTRQRRVIEINDTAQAWLKQFGGKAGPVTVTRNADVWGQWLRDLAKSAGIEVWPKNALRHGFGSYFFALIKDENRVAAEMGNSPAIVHRHYRALVTSTQSQAFWAIFPPDQASGRKEAA